MTIDGESAVGKSELSEKLTKTVPKELNLTCVHFDTGIFFRVIAFATAKDGKDVDHMPDKELEDYLFSWPFSLEFVKDDKDVGTRIKYYKEIDGLRTELTEQMLRSEEADHAASKLGANSVVTQWMEKERKKIVMNSGIDMVIINGRDTAANYFKEADLKIILDDDKKSRAKRRTWEKRFAGEKVDYGQVMKSLMTRDAKDADLLQYNSSLSGVWEIDRTGLSSKKLSELVTQALGVLTEGKISTKYGDTKNNWQTRNENDDLLSSALLEVDHAFSDPILAVAILGISKMHRIVQRYDSVSKRLLTLIKYK